MQQRVDLVRPEESGAVELHSSLDVALCKGPQEREVAFVPLCGLLEGVLQDHVPKVAQVRALRVPVRRGVLPFTARGGRVEARGPPSLV